MFTKQTTLRSLLVLSVIFTAVISCKENKEANTPATASFFKYDSTLAAKYGADDYGMKKYVVAFLYRGENRPADPELAAELQKKHLENINRLAEEGKLVLAGPFFGEGELRGIYIFDTPSIEDAEALTNSDPAIQAGSLRMELLEWYGSAALLAVNELHSKLSRMDVSD